MALAENSNGMLIVQRLMAVYEVTRTSAPSSACADDECLSSYIACRESFLRPSRPFKELRNLMKALKLP